jgi:hypothetical protein
LIVQQINKTYYPEMRAYLAAFPPSNLVVMVEFAPISQYHADCSLTMALAQLGNGQASHTALTKADLAANTTFTSPSGTVVALGIATATGFQTTITPPGGAASSSIDEPSDVLVVLLNRLSATKK